ncbi:MAG TPA: hypothetical protein VJB60_03665, partial [Candidatus Peribacterales bacterium]|nr:hypothetical protein [Candidatus Peribacterales bacterium]
HANSLGGVGTLYYRFHFAAGMVLEENALLHHSTKYDGGSAGKVFAEEKIEVYDRTPISASTKN